MAEFSHVDGETASMVDVTDKPEVYREAVAAGEIALRPETVEAVRQDSGVKENALPTARVAAIRAVKRTWDDIPMCHQIPVTDVTVEFALGETAIEARVAVTSTGQTGVEMEALNGVTRGLLTVWDMVKSAEKDEEGQYPDTRIRDIRVERKVKGAVEDGPREE
jgi:cyclic pyranopterin phosphate synthase